MNTMLLVIIVFIIGELIIHPLFFFVSILLGKEKRDRITIRTVFKGVIERIFVLTVLCLEVASALTLLGALKIATRFKENENKVSNDFFLIGNLISVLFGFAYFVVLRNLVFNG